ncbi:hypothetical protein D3H55_22035 [Bacillus salacetis]|uniref:Uncharacterized protein n=1 Tax=Bacillus salacetis TaxID=2315464 RepID=A0A3A1QRN5_9BACI|nr:hypothetical protein D3H55_22035 [Bacillus salacetis]
MIPSILIHQRTIPMEVNTPAILMDASLPDQISVYLISAIANYIISIYLLKIKAEMYLKPIPKLYKEQEPIALSCSFLC